MKTFYRIFLLVVIVAVIIGVLYLLRNTKVFGNLWVALSSAYAAFLIFLSKMKNLFARPDSTVEGLEQRLAEVNRIEKELIDTLMKERQVYRERMDQLESEFAGISAEFQKQENVVAGLQDVETWTENVWENLTEEEQDELTEETIGKVRTIEAFAFDYTQ